MKKPRLTYEPKGLQLTDDEFHRLHTLAAKNRSGRSITVPAEALRHLLSDHSALYGRLDEVDRSLRSPGHEKPLGEPPRPLAEPKLRHGVAVEEDLIG